jgi:hypothetical protein
MFEKYKVTVPEGKSGDWEVRKITAHRTWRKRLFKNKLWSSAAIVVSTVELPVPRFWPTPGWGSGKENYDHATMILCF